MGLRKNWQKITLDRFLKRKTITQMMNISTEEESDDEDDAISNWEEGKISTSYYTYAGIGKVLDCIYKNHPLSLIKLTDTTIGCAISGKKMMEIERLHHVKETLGMNYFIWKIKENKDDEGNAIPNIIEYKLPNIASCILLLPELDENGYQKGLTHEEKLYTMVDWNWKQIDKNGEMKLPERK